MGESQNFEVALGAGLAQRYCSVEWNIDGVRCARSRRFYPTDEARTIMKRPFVAGIAVPFQGSSCDQYERVSYAHTPFLSKNGAVRQF
jgi:hypothetical protein